MVALRRWHTTEAVGKIGGAPPSDGTSQFEPMRVDMPKWTDHLQTSSPAPAISLPVKVPHSGIVDGMGMLEERPEFSLLVYDQTQSVLLDQSATGLPSRGSALHASGACRPCAWFWKPAKCQNGQECWHCHLCPEGELKSRKKSKLAMMRSGVHSEQGGQTSERKPSPPYPP